MRHPAGHRRSVRLSLARRRSVALLIAALLGSNLAHQAVLPASAAEATGERPSNQQPRSVAAAASAPPGAAKPADFVEGDTLKIAFYEQLENGEDKWRGSAGRPVAPRGFHQRAELTGEYQVQEDGTISVPMLGRFTASGESFGSLQETLARPFEALIGRPGFVNVLSVEHQPIYVVGPVKNPGSFKYRSGMTVLHAVALAGGMRRIDVEPWQRIEAERQFESLHKSLQRVKRLLLRTNVLKSERDGGESAASEVTKLVGPRDAVSLAQEEKFGRGLVAISRKAQEAALVRGVDDARSELNARSGRVATFDESIKLRRERVQNIRQLVGQDIINRPVLIQAQGELSEVEDRRQQAQIDVEASRQRLSQAESELQKQRMEGKVELDKSIAAAQRDTTEAANDSEGLLDILRKLTANSGPTDAEGSLSYEVVRRGVTGAQTLMLPETAPLRPGDLVRVRSQSAELMR